MRAREIAEALDARRLEVCRYLFPNGKQVGSEYHVGSLAGEIGDSLKIHLNGKGALWRDFATDDKGGADMLELWARARHNGDIGAAMREAIEWLGIDRNGKQTRIASRLRSVTAARPTQATQPKLRAQAGAMPEAHPTLGKPSVSWIYRSKHGDPVAAVFRFDFTNGEGEADKTYRPYDLVASDWTMEPPRPLYRLDELAKNQRDPVVIVEGEKCADALASVGILATTVMGGAQAVGQADIEPLRDRTVYVWRDNDNAGEEWLEKLLGTLREIAGAVFIVPIPDGAPRKWDAADAIAEGWTAERVRELITTAERPARKLKGYTLDELLALDIPAREHMLEPWLHTKSVCMVHSWRGVGKTFFALNVAYAVASGGQYLRWKAPRPRKVLYLDGEMVVQDIKVRLQEIVECADTKLRAPDDLVIVGADMQDNPMPDLTTPEGRAALDEWLADGFEFVVIDNLSTLTSGAENDDEAWIPMQQLALALRRRGIGVLFVHHSGKSGKQRGTSKREDICETVISLRHPADYKPNEGLRFEIHFEKKRGFHGVDAEPVEATLGTGQRGKQQWTTRTVEDAQRRQAIELLREGLKAADVVVEVGVSRATVFRWQREARANGLLE